MFIPFDSVLKKFFPSMTVVIVTEDVHPGIAAQNDMIEAAGQVNPGFARHIVLQAAVRGTGEVMPGGLCPQGEFMGK